MTKTINLIWWKFDPSVAYEYDWLNFLLSDFKVNHLVDFNNELCLDNAIIVANLSQALFAEQGARDIYRQELQQFDRYINRFKAEGRRVGLFHLGDEFYKESTHFYKNLDFVFRQYYKEEDHRKHRQCYYLPFGYKSGFRDHLVSKPIAKRDYLWSFAGHLKGSRFAMLEQAKKIPDGKYHTTTQWNDPKGLTTQEYADLLGNTVFTLSPMGNYSVDCFRVCEALEAGSIPIIEAKGIREALSMLFDLRSLLKYGTWDRKFWLRNYRYWERTYPEDFPCPLIYDWKNLEAVIQSIDHESLSYVSQAWWKDCKQALVQQMQTTVDSTFA